MTTDNNMPEIMSSMSTKFGLGSKVKQSSMYNIATVIQKHFGIWPLIFVAFLTDFLNIR